MVLYKQEKDIFYSQRMLRVVLLHTKNRVKKVEIPLQIASGPTSYSSAPFVMPILLCLLIQAWHYVLKWK